VLSITSCHLKLPGRFPCNPVSSDPAWINFCTFSQAIGIANKDVETAKEENCKEETLELEERDLNI